MFMVHPHNYLGYNENVPQSSTRIKQCRLCGNAHLKTILDLGDQYLTGIFPASDDPTNLTSGSLEIVQCTGPNSSCGLVQLSQSFPPNQMYGETYGYRSGLNQTMVEHLGNMVKKLISMVQFDPGDLVVDIGSNDGTTLGFFSPDLSLLGIDPSASKFGQYYREDILRIPEFFSRATLEGVVGEKKAKAITSFAMLYDLEDPLSFAQDVSSCLSAEGIWLFEQSYLPSMIENLAFDTICHEHVEYYGLHQIKYMLEHSGMRILDAGLTPTNGGSFWVAAVHQNSSYPELAANVSRLLKYELDHGYLTSSPLEKFARQTNDMRYILKESITGLSSRGAHIAGLGASTKGNVLLQYAELGRSEIESIGEVNEEKIGCFTPGTWIPIQSQADVLRSNPDFLLVLPWHFRDFFIKSDIFENFRLIFPLPSFNVVQR